MKIIRIIEKATGLTNTAQYAPNRLGNLRMWVDGRFYSDKDFDKKYKVVTDHNDK